MANKIILNGIDQNDLAHFETFITQIDQREMAQAEQNYVLTMDDLEGLIGISENMIVQVNVALKSGKKHLMFFGPPGTGKTTIAKRVAEKIRDNYVLITASADWSSQDIIGGYQPTGDGSIVFSEGVLLRYFDRPLIIDELNRCDIDKVLGPFFTVLSGQATELPYLDDPSDKDSKRHTILPHPKTPREDHEHAPGESWCLFTTINTVDKASLYQMSYALARRFAWIYVGIPGNLAEFIQKFILQEYGIAPPEDASIPLAGVWEQTNVVRPIGPAPIVDLIKFCVAQNEDFNFYELPNDPASRTYLNGYAVCVLPMLDGILPDEAEKLKIALLDRLNITDENMKSFINELFDTVVL